MGNLVTKKCSRHIRSSSMRREVSLPKRPLVLCLYYGLKNEGRIVAMVMIMGLALSLIHISEPL